MEMNSTNLLWFLAFVFLAGGNGFGGLFGNNGAGVQAAIDNQTIQQQLQQIALSSANNNYETAQLLNQQSNLLQQQNNTNQINVVQGFNSVVQQLQNQTSSLANQISQLGYQMDQCCCSIKTQMLQDRLTDKTAEAVALQNKIDNRDQTQTILNNLGRFVAWAGSGSPATTSVGG